MNKPQGYSFTDYVRNPHLFRRIWSASGGAPKRSWLEKLLEFLVPSSQRQPPTLAELVAAMGRRGLHSSERRQLVQAGEQVVPLLLAALQDEQFFFHRYEIDWHGSTLETALDLLEPFALPEMRLLEPALQHPDEFFRKAALYHLARCANDEAVDTLVEALRSSSESSRTFVLLGLGFLKESRRGTQKFRKALYEAALPRLADDEFSAAGYAASAMIALDRDCAAQVLMSEGIFSSTNERLFDILKVLNEEDVVVPAARTRALLVELKPKATDYPFDRAYGEGLILLSRAEGTSARDLIDEARTWGNTHVRESAAEALCFSAGVDDAHGHVWKIYREQGIASLTPVQRTHLALWWLDAEVRNGGFSQFYFDSSGDFAPYAADGARTVGAPQLAAIVDEANALFGKHGPPENRERRMNRLSRLDLDALRRLDTRYYECSEKLSELLPTYVATHPDEFKRPMAQ